MHTTCFFEKKFICKRNSLHDVHCGIRLQQEYQSDIKVSRFLERKNIICCLYYDCIFIGSFKPEDCKPTYKISIQRLASRRKCAWSDEKTGCGFVPPFAWRF
jgi:hypothetical protein